MAAAPAGESSSRGPDPSKVIWSAGEERAWASMGLCKVASATSGSPARTAAVATSSQRQPPHPHSRAPHLALALEGRSTAGRGHQA
eukprot:1352969-Alexandrium_andersonii.AAC.1